MGLFCIPQCHRDLAGSVIHMTLVVCLEVQQASVKSYLGAVFEITTYLKMRF